MLIQTLQGDCREVLKSLADNSVNCCVTSPPYFGLRDYQSGPGEIGQETTYQDYLINLLTVFKEVYRVLKPDGTLWVNIGDSYSNKQLLGIPWRLAFALQDIRFKLRQDIIWSKPNPKPESVNDRCTTSHEYLFFLTKSRHYFYDAQSIREPSADPERKNFTKPKRMTSQDYKTAFGREHHGFNNLENMEGNGHNKWSVWTVATIPYSDAHFATFPEKLIEPCILSGCPAGGTVLDPFAGSGTTGRVAVKHGRNAILIELNEKYHELIDERTDKVQVKMAI